MLAIMHRQAGGGVAFERISQGFIDIVTGPGYGGDSDYVAEQSRRMRLPDEDGRSRFSQEFGDRWASVIANGSVTESALYALLTERARAHHGFTESLLVDQDELHAVLAASDADRAALTYEGLKSRLHTMEID